MDFLCKAFSLHCHAICFFKSVNYGTYLTLSLHVFFSIGLKGQASAVLASIFALWVCSTIVVLMSKNAGEHI